MSESTGNDPQDPARDYPIWVRLLAVTYVFSFASAPIGCIVLGLIGSYLFVRRGTADGLVITFWISAVVFPLGCAFFRWWLVQWGRRYEETRDAELVTGATESTKKN